MNLPGILKTARGAGSRASDLALAAFVVGILAMMILPLPTPLLDVLITCSVASGVLILLVALYVEDALRISAFPSVILLSTLFRLAIEVSATRLILGQANAGEVIRAFGGFVVRGNFVVGAVVFLILTLVQFLVIARGAERVAEVGARFTLDAMPGKQMAIDAELRAGGIDMAEARRRRAALQRESQLYGAMDGAMKFVKGDAIAGIAIITINIVAGLLIGVLQHGMPLGQAVRVYSVLTIGDGLVAQIPALLMSTSAGLVVTRVAGEEEGAGLGRDVGRQIGAQPRALALAAAVLGLLALVPGLPHAPFLVVALAAGAGAWVLVRRARREAAVVATDTSEAGAGMPLAPPTLRGPSSTTRTAPRAESFVPGVVPVLLELAEELDEAAPDGEARHFLREQLPELRRALFRDLGIQVPGVRVRGGVPGLAAGGFVVRINELPVLRGLAPPGHVLALAEPPLLESRGLSVQAAELPSGPPCGWIATGDAATVREAGIRVLDRGEVLCRHLAAAVRRRAGAFMGIQEAQGLLDALERSHPALVREVVPRLVSVGLLADILRRLLDEGVSIRNLRDILEALAVWGPQEKDPVLLTEYVRAAIGRQISLRHAPTGTLPVHLLDREIEEAVRGGVHKSGTSSFLALEPSASRDILDAVRQALGARPPGAPPPILLTSMELRRWVRKLVEIEHPDVTVLSFQELAPDVRVQPVGRIGVGAA